MIPTLKTGSPAYYDGLHGLVPCKVVSITGPSGRPSSAQQVNLVVTRNTRLYAPGYRFSVWALHAIPPKAIRRRKYSTRITVYTVESDPV